jgi:hypothetical protein
MRPLTPAQGLLSGDALRQGLVEGNSCTVSREGANSGFFIIPHEAAVARYIGAEDRRQLAFHADRGRRSDIAPPPGR